MLPLIWTLYGYSTFEIQKLVARSEKVENEKKRDSKDRGQEADGKKGSPKKLKPI